MWGSDPTHLTRGYEPLPRGSNSLPRGSNSLPRELDSRAGSFSTGLTPDWHSYPTRYTQDWSTWLTWQGKQDGSHFQTCPIFTTYETVHPVDIDYQRDHPTYQVLMYCFGAFTRLIPLDKISSQDILRLTNLLLQFYDYNKGYYRRFALGDPDNIRAMRAFSRGLGEKALQQIDFMQVLYPYDQLHAHTVVQYSLSTLIVRIFSHLLALSSLPAFPAYQIDINLCRLAVDRAVFGKVYRFNDSTQPRPSPADEDLQPEISREPLVKSRPIDIPLRGLPPAGSFGSAPGQTAKCLHCYRYTESYELNGICLDCVITGYG